jgi:hypothetical protein
LNLKDTKTTGKLRFAAHCTFLRDIIDTICEFGFNPKIESKNGMNQGLQLYVGYA